jgi:hypothetical protein
MERGTLPWTVAKVQCNYGANMTEHFDMNVLLQRIGNVGEAGYDSS